MFVLHISIVFVSASSLCSPVKVLIYVVERGRETEGKSAAVAFNVPRGKGASWEACSMLTG